MYPRGKAPPGFNGEGDAVSWHRNVFGRLNDTGDPRPQTCVVEAGEVIYVPPWWYHQTLNLDRFNSFMSVFAYVDGARPKT